MNYKMVKFKLSSWRKLRRAFYGRKNETFSDYIERLSRFCSIQKIKPILLDTGSIEDTEKFKKKWEKYLK